MSGNAFNKRKSLKRISLTEMMLFDAGETEKPLRKLLKLALDGVSKNNFENLKELSKKIEIENIFVLLKHRLKLPGLKKVAPVLFDSEKELIIRKSSVEKFFVWLEKSKSPEARLFWLQSIFFLLQRFKGDPEYVKEQVRKASDYVKFKKNPLESLKFVSDPDFREFILTETEFGLRLMKKQRRERRKLSL